MARQGPTTVGTGATCWGADPDAGTQPPTPVTGLEDTPLTQVDGVTSATGLGTSGYDTWATTQAGTWAWGSNQWGQTDPAEPGTSTTPHQEDR